VVTTGTVRSSEKFFETRYDPRMRDPKLIATAAFVLAFFAGLVCTFGLRLGVSVDVVQLLVVVAVGPPLIVSISFAPRRQILLMILQTPFLILWALPLAPNRISYLFLSLKLLSLCFLAYAFLILIRSSKAKQT